MKPLLATSALSLHLSISTALAAISISASAQAVYVPVYAPYAQQLVLATKKSHAELQKLGLHAIPPGEKDYAIIANGIPSKIGKKSSEGDLKVVQSGAPTVKRDEKGKFFDLCLPIADAANNVFGITVMEIPYADSANEQDALAKATVVRDEMQRKISSYDQLFEKTDVALKDIESIPLGAQGKRFDHFGVDLKHHRLFLAAEDSHSVLMVDSVDSRLTGKIDGFGVPHAILYRDDLNRIYVTDGKADSGKAGALKIFDGKDDHLLSSVPLAADADSIGYDPARLLLYVDNGGKDAGLPYSLVSVIDTTAGAKTADIRVESGTLEAMALDLWRPRMYVNNRAQNQVTVIDRWQNKVIASWPVTLGKDNVAMTLDEAHQRLFVGCRSGQVVVFDTNTGKELQAFAITPGVDDLEYDPASKRVYAAGGGTVDVFEETDADHFRSLGNFATGTGAKTGRLVSAINRYYAAVPGGQDGNAKVQVFQPLNLPPGPKPPAPEEPVKVDAPFALKLEIATLSAHPDLRKMGLHAIPPGGKDSVIIANANTARIGFKSSDGDLAAVKDGKTYCAKRDDGSFFNAKLPLKDASGNTIGILVMEIPFTSASNETEAVQKAESIRQELAQQIPAYDSLFQR
jgi:DNA-binding beta-propeller fold protein YncE